MLKRILHFLLLLVFFALIYLPTFSHVSAAITNIDTLVKFTGEAALDNFGYSTSSAGDVNNDGYDDVIVGANQYNGGTYQGRAYIFYGSSSPSDLSAANADIILTGEAALDNFGYSTSSAGDVNNDGYDDVIVGAVGYNGGTNQGRAYIFYGGPSMVSEGAANADVIFIGESAGDYFGNSVSLVNDVNNDGYNDVFVGAYKHDGGTGQGRTYIFYGGPSMVSEGAANADVILAGESADDLFGRDISFSSDINNDGYVDIIVTGVGYNGGTKQGRVYVYSLNYASPGLSINDFSATNDTTPEISGTATETGANVAGVQWSFGNTYLGTWNDCTASDGNFNSSSENFSCIIQNSDLSNLNTGNYSIHVRSYDSNSVYLPSTLFATNNFVVDTHSPSISNLAIVNVSMVSGGGVYDLGSTNRMPIFSGKVSDPYSVGISSGPEKIILTLNKLDAGQDPDSNPTYTQYLSQEYTLSNIQDNYGVEKYTNFYITIPYPLLDGYYEVNLASKDRADNTYNHSTFYMTLNYQGTGVITETELETELEEELETTILEEEKIEEEGYSVQVKVVDEEGNPVKGAKVTLYSTPKVAYTDENGVATFNNVEKGEHKVKISYKGQTGEQDLSLQGDTQQVNLTIQTKQTNPFLSVPVLLIIVPLIILSGVLFLLYVKKT